MPGRKVATLGASEILWMVFAASQAFKIEISPESHIVAQIGGSSSLNCSTTGCEAPAFSWRTQMDSPLSAKVRSEGTTSTLTMDPVGFGNEHSYLCTANCRAGKAERGVKVVVYSFPKDPEIHLSGPLEAGKPVTATCLVPDVYPPDGLEVELLKGDRTLKIQEFLEPVATRSLETKTLDVTFTPTTEDTGKALVCRAKLYLQEIGVKLPDRQTAKELQVNEKPFTVEISPGPQVTAQIGSSVVLTCGVMHCESPAISWGAGTDRPLGGAVRSQGPRSTLTLSPVGFEHQRAYLCTVACGQQRLEKEVKLDLYSFPGDPEVEVRGVLASGSSAAVRCRVPDVYPVDRLEIELLKGAETMASKNFVEDVDRKSLETRSLDMTFIPTTEDTGKVLVCRAKLNIDGAEFEPKQRQSAQPLHVNVAPRNTTIVVRPSPVVPEGGSVTMTCSSHGLPAPEIRWSRLLPGGHRQRLSENATLTFISTERGDSGTYVCEGRNQAGISTKKVELIIQVAPRDLQLTASPSESVKEGDTVTISCTCVNVPQTRVVLKKKAEAGDTVLEAVEGAYTIHKAQLEDAGVYECESEHGGGRQLRSLLTLDVKGRESRKDYFSPGLLLLYGASSLIVPAVGAIVYFARRAHMRGSYSLVEAQKSKV